MKTNMKWLRISSLSLFDGGAGAAGGAAGEGGTAAMGDTTGSAAENTRRGKTGEDKSVTVLYGVQDDAGTADAGRKETEVKTTSNTLDDKKRAFNELIRGEYKDIYTEMTQSMIDRRFKQTKALEESAGKMRPVIDMLSQRYGVPDGDPAKLLAAIENDDGYWNEAAAEAGMDVAQYKQFKAYERENAELKRAMQEQDGAKKAEQQLQEWYTAADKLKELYPDFDLNTECANPEFLKMLQRGISVEHAYKMLHFDDLMNGAVAKASNDTERRVVDNIRAKGQRPQENGTGAKSAFIVKDDVHKLTREDRARIAREVEKGNDHISFGKR